MRTRMWSVALAIGVAMGGQPQGCEDQAKGRMIEPFEYLTREDGYMPPAPGEVTLYQTNGPMTAGSVQALAEGVDGTIYAGTFGDGVYMKPRDADRWIPAEQGPGDRFLLTLAATPGGTVFAGTIQGGMFRSEDGGRHWVSSSQGMGLEQVAAILHDPRSGRLYAGTGSGVFVSDDEGRQWAAANRGLETALARSLAVGPDGTLYTGTGGNGLFASEDRGSRWRPINEGMTDERGLRENFIRVLAVDRTGAIYAGSFGGGVFKTTTQGRRWTAVNEGLTNLSIRGLVVAPDALYVGTGEGVFRSVNGGRRWDSISEGMANTNVQSLLLSRDGTLYAGTSGGVAVRAPGGGWRLLDRGMLFPTVRALAADARRGLFAGTEANGLYRSKDGGQSWGPFNDGIQSRTIRALAVDSKGVPYAATPDAIYRADWGLSRWVSESEGLVGSPTALLAGADRLYALTSSGLFVRTDGASQWTAISEPAAEGVRAAALDRKNRLVAVTDREVFSHDGGDWTSLGGPPNAGPLLGVTAGRVLYAWTATAVYARRGASARWEKFGTGWPRNVLIRTVAVDTVDGDDALIAATSGGVWWAVSGREWKPATSQFPALPFATLLVARTGLIMAGAEEHGVFVGVNRVASRGLFGLS